MAFSDLQLKVASEYAIQDITKHLGAFDVFAHNFKELYDRPGSTIAVPVMSLSAAGEFNAESNNWCSTQSVGGTTVSLEKQYIASIGIQDTDILNTDVNLLRDGTTAIVQNLTVAANKYVFGALSADGISELSGWTGGTKSAFADLFATADTKGLDPYQCVLVLAPTYFAKLLGTLDAHVYGGSEAVQNGIIPGLYGFYAVICSSYLPSGWNGAIVKRDAIGVVTRIDKPGVNGYVASWNAVAPNGIGINLRVFENLCKGQAVLGGDLLIGAKVLQPTGIVKLYNS